MASKINKSLPVYRVLVVPLDWGLGHATRCIPIINSLLRQNVEVYFAAEKNLVKLLGEQPPGLVILRLKGYEIRYSNSKKFFLSKLFLQLPKVMWAIYQENRWLKKIISKYNINAVISDNRFGLYSKNIPSVFITHQLHIETGNAMLNKLAQKINYHFINKYSRCWVPDIEGKPNIAGLLSHPESLPLTPVQYIGNLSRFSYYSSEKKYDLLIMLSGPEPQRTIFENILLTQCESFKGNIIFVRGLPLATASIKMPNQQLAIYNHLSATVLNEKILQSKTIIARCGYSTVMDLLALKQKAILVPTPGQTEQEYLSNHLNENRLFYCCPQYGFSLTNALEYFHKFNFVFLPETGNLYEKVVADWLKEIPDNLNDPQ